MASILSVIVGAVAMKMAMASAVSPMVFVIVAVIFIATQFFHFMHHFDPISGSVGMLVIVLGILLLRAGFGSSPFDLSETTLLGVMITLQLIKLPFG